MNVKWLDHLELRSEPGPNTAKAIALSRLPNPKKGWRWSVLYLRSEIHIRFDT